LVEAVQLALDLLERHTLRAGAQEVVVLAMHDAERESGRDRSSLQRHAARGFRLLLGRLLDRLAGRELGSRRFLGHAVILRGPNVRATSYLRRVARNPSDRSTMTFSKRVRIAALFLVLPLAASVVAAGCSQTGARSTPAPAAAA